MSNTPSFLLDANVLIRAKNEYYSFEIAPSYWSWMTEKVEQREILILDKVYTEIVRGNDPLSLWLNHEIGKKNTVSSADILPAYAAVINHINDPKYPSAKTHEWAQNNIADPWMIAYALTYPEITIATHETRIIMDRHGKYKTIKIPNVCDELGVSLINPFEMMATLKICL